MTCSEILKYWFIEKHTGDANIMLYIEKLFCSMKIGQSPHCLSKQEQRDFAPRLQVHNLAILGVYLGIVGPSLEIVVKRHSKSFCFCSW